MKTPCSRDRPSPGATAAAPLWSVKRWLWTAALAGSVAAAEWKVSAPLHHFGMCDASAAVAISDQVFAVGNDEDNVLRFYSRFQPGDPIASLDLDEFLGVDPDAPEADLEAAARAGNRTYWITSHGRNKNGKERPSRQRFFALDLPATGARLSLVPSGRPCKDLLRAMLADARLRPFELARASTLAPKEPGGFNIEGLATRPDGSLWIGFRNPIPGGRALIVPLLNPDAVIQGAAPELGEPQLLDLGGLGIRALEWVGDRYLVIAGSPDAGGRSYVYGWKEQSAAPERLPIAPLLDFNPEALVVDQAFGVRRFQLLSDDGTRLVGGAPCKELDNPAQRSFRSLWVASGD